MKRSWETVPHDDRTAGGIVMYGDSVLPEDLTQRRDALSQADSLEILNMVQSVHGLLRNTGGPHAFDRDAGKYGFDTGVLDEAAVPDVRDVEGLLDESWLVASGFLNDHNLSDEKALRLAGITIANAILLTHPYIDANGRTSRAVSYLMAARERSVDSMERIVAHHLGDRHWLVQPQFVQKTARRRLAGLSLDLHASKLTRRNDLANAVSYAPYAVREGVAKILAELMGDAVDHLRSADGTINESEIMGSFLVGSMIHEGKAAVDAYRQARAEVVQMFLKDMQNPTGRSDGQYFRERQLSALYNLSSALRR